MRTIAAELVELDDQTVWIRLPGRMIEVRPDDAAWVASGGCGLIGSPAEPDPEPPAALPPDGPASEPVAASTSSSDGEAATPRRRGIKANPALVQRVRRLVEDEHQSLTKAAKAAGKSLATVYTWAERERWLTPKKIRDAARMIEARGYSVMKAAAAVKVSVEKLQAVLDREAPKPTPTPKATRPTRSGRTARERCPHCGQNTTTNPCQHCLERRTT